MPQVEAKAFDEVHLLKEESVDEVDDLFADAVVRLAGPVLSVLYEVLGDGTARDHDRPAHSLRL